MRLLLVVFLILPGLSSHSMSLKSSNDFFGDNSVSLNASSEAFTNSLIDFTSNQPHFLSASDQAFADIESDSILASNDNEQEVASQLPQKFFHGGQQWFPPAQDGMSTESAPNDLAFIFHAYPDAGPKKNINNSTSAGLSAGFFAR